MAGPSAGDRAPRLDLRLPACPPDRGGGTPPIVHKTGGLADTVAPFDPSSGRGTGFVFEHFTPEGFAWALSQALDHFPNRPLWDHLMKNGMSQNFSWDEVGTSYVRLYNHLVSGGRG